MIDLSEVDLSETGLVIILTLVILALSLVLVRQHWLGCRIQSAAREWYAHNVALMSHRANVVRDSSLQELFVLRRSLELATLSREDMGSGQYQAWIQQLEAVHNSINHLIDSIVPPFMEESLPLAISAYLKGLHNSQRQFKLSMQHCRKWSLNDQARVSKAIVCFFKQLEAYIGAPDGINSVNVTFAQVNVNKQILIELGCASYDGVSRIYDKVQDLCRIVGLLSAVKYHVLPHGRSLSLELRWSTAEEQRSPLSLNTRLLQDYGR